MMNLNLTANIKMPDHQLRRQVIDLCNKTPRITWTTGWDTLLSNSADKPVW